MPLHVIFIDAFHAEIIFAMPRLSPPHVTSYAIDAAAHAHFFFFVTRHFAFSIIYGFQRYRRCHRCFFFFFSLSGYAIK